MTINRSKVIGHFSILFAVIIFGLNGPISKDLLGPNGFSPWVHIFVRFIGGSILFWLSSLFIKAPEIDKKDFGRVVVAAVCVIILNLGCFAFAISITSAIDQSLISTLGPIFTMILAAIFLKEPITRLKALGVIVGSSGVLVLVLSAPEGTQESNIWGAVLSIIATVGYSVYLTLFKTLIDKYHPIVLMKWMFLSAAIIALPFTLPSVLATDWASYPNVMIGEFAFIVFFSTFVAYLLMPISQKRIRPTVISMYSYGIPIVATIATFVMGQDQPTVIKGVAAFLVLIGVYMVTVSKSRTTLIKEQKLK